VDFIETDEPSSKRAVSFKVSDEELNTVLAEGVKELRKTGPGIDLLIKFGRSIRNPDKGNRETAPFIAWDGEGITELVNGRKRHHYILFGASDGTETRAPEGRGLSTIECFETMIRSAELNPGAIHVAFAFGYDSEKILSDIGFKTMAVLADMGRCRWDQYSIQYFKGKWLSVTRNTPKGRVTCKIWDVFGFFQTSFVNSLRMLFGNEKEFDEIEYGKKHRDSFRYDELDELIVPYWRSELVWMVKIAEYLRTLLYRADLRITDWHGPGAIASYIFKSRNIERYKAVCPAPVNLAAQYAFSGGRFEPFKVGRANTRIYVYDINSAHPTGMAQLPDLSHNRWRHVDESAADPLRTHYGVYRITYFGILSPGDRREVHPFFCRHKNGTVSWPRNVTGWYWAPEVKATILSGHDNFTVHEGWELEDNGIRPFEYIHEMYAQRQIWKRPETYEPAQLALKLGLNSQFGKCAQRVGWNRKRRTPPKWHQLENAGWITSYTRSLLWEAIVQARAKDSLVSVDTDAVFSTEPLSLNEGDNLGQWDYNVYRDMIYLQSGIYFLQKDDGSWKPKFRGLDPDSISVERVIDYFNELDFNVPFGTKFDEESDPFVLSGSTTRFISCRQASQLKEFETRGQWVTSPRRVNIGTKGKRVHFNDHCYACATSAEPGTMFHDLGLLRNDGISHRHPLPWLETDGKRESDVAKWEDPIIELDEFQP